MKNKAEQQKTADQKEHKRKSRLRENIEAIVIAVLLALFIRAFVVQAFKIPSGSMEPTLQVGDHILVNKFIYGVRLPIANTTIIPVSEPERGDIIVFEYPVDPDKDFIKRVVAVAGDVVEIRDKKVYVNGRRVDNYLVKHTGNRVLSEAASSRDNFGPVTVPQDSYFVLGDNRDNSYDSRFWGFVRESALKGEAFIIYWSWDSDDFGVRWGRIGKILQ
ncbi:MAG: signal peptidase I [Desulfobacteraceae bacterium]|nr:signal peptidase I [Desulfobacteraceae bacterium]MCF8095287.1 signal peptidase I [Desulfobacteraceae bacterium]